MASELNSVHVLAPGVEVTGYRHRQERFMPHFTLSEDGTYAFCHNIPSLMAELGLQKIRLKEV